MKNEINSENIMKYLYNNFGSELTNYDEKLIDNFDEIERKQFIKSMIICMYDQMNKIKELEAQKENELKKKNEKRREN